MKLAEYKNYLILLLIAFLFFVSSLGFYAYISFKKNALLKPVSQSAGDLGFENLPSPPDEAIYNVLLLGHGDPGHPGGDLADSLMVVHLDTKQKKAVLVSIPRDTWLSLPMGEGKFEPHKINEAYLVGKKARGEEFGFSLIKQAITKVTNLPINYFIFVNFGKFMEVVDTLGGIEVDVPKAFDDYFYPVRGRELETCGKNPEEVAELSATLSGFDLEKQFECRYEHLHFDQGETKMNGEMALKFTRSRHSSQHGGDFARAERQQAVILGFKDKLISLDGLEKAPELFEKLIHLVRTDLDQKIVKEVARSIVDPAEYQIAKLVLSTDNVFDSSRNFRGQFVLIPKAGEDQWAQIHQLIQGKIQSGPGN